MIPIILVTHGPLAASFIESAEMLVGESEKLEAISLEPSDNFEEFQQKILEKARRLNNGDGVLVLVDLLGGSPYNAASKLLIRENIECLTGLNLSMLLTALDQREYCDLRQLKEECREAAVANIVDTREALLANDSEEDDEEG